MATADQELKQFRNPNEVSTTPTQQELQQYVTPQYAAGWREIGVELGLSDAKLRFIKQDHPHRIKECCNEMFSEWLRVETTATWEKLFSAIDSGVPVRGVSTQSRHVSITISPPIPAQKPTMKQMKKIVIPKIAAHWKDVADFLEYDISTIERIEEKFGRDCDKCCDELLRSWISSNHGVGPKTWGTLVTTLKEIDNLTAATEYIEKELGLN